MAEDQPETTVNETPVEETPIEETPTATEETTPAEEAPENGQEETPAEEPEEPEEEVEYDCPSEFDEKEELCKMFVGGLSKDTTDEEFKALFETYGEIKDVAIIRKADSKSDRLIGFVIFAKCDNLDDCLLARPHKYKERELDVKRAVPKGQNDGSGHYKV